MTYQLKEPGSKEYNLPYQTNLRVSEIDKITLHLSFRGNARGYGPFQIRLHRSSKCGILLRTTGL